jgi:hypothetical protein
MAPVVPPPPPTWKQLAIWAGALVSLLVCAVLGNLLPVAICATGAPYDREVCELSELARRKQRNSRLKHAAAWTVVACAAAALALYMRWAQLAR